MKRIGRNLGLLLLWLGIWWGISALVGNALLLPGPKDTWLALSSLAVTQAFWQDTLLSLGRVLLGYLLGVLSGSILGMVCYFVRSVGLILEPVKHILRATPVVSFIILVLLWLKTGMVPVFISFLMVLPLMWTAMQDGLAQTSGSLLEMARMYRFRKSQKLFKIYFPSLLPSFLTSCKNGIGLAWKAGISAEVIARPVQAIGARLQDAKVYLETPELFAWTGVVIILSLLLEKLLTLLTGLVRHRMVRQ